MTPESRDPAYLWDMLGAARSIQRFTAGVSLDQYLQNEMMQLAVERQLEVIGEAARRVSDTFKRAHPEIPWQPIVAQRNRSRVKTWREAGYSGVTGNRSGV